MHLLLIHTIRAPHSAAGVLIRIDDLMQKDAEQDMQKELEHVKAKCPEVKFIAHYALLGRYDFLDIYEAPDEESAAKVSMISLSEGAFQSESLFAIPYKRFLELTEEIK